MASFLDITGLQHFSSLFVFAFSWAVVYMVFVSSKFFSGNKILPAFISFVISLFILLNPFLVDVIRMVAPWMGVGFVIIMFLWVIFRVLLPNNDEVTEGVRTVVIFIFLAILIIGLAGRVKTALGDDPDDIDDVSSVRNTLLHPKILGAVLLMLVGLLTVALLTQVQT